jgi:hypothetical protein
LLSNEAACAVLKQQGRQQTAEAKFKPAKFGAKTMRCCTATQEPIVLLLLVLV